MLPRSNTVVVYSRDHQPSAAELSLQPLHLSFDRAQALLASNQWSLQAPLHWSVR